MQDLPENFSKTFMFYLFTVCLCAGLTSWAVKGLPVAITWDIRCLKVKSITAVIISIKAR